MSTVSNNAGEALPRKSVLFACPSRTLDQLAPFGVRLATPVGRPFYYVEDNDVWKTIGAVSVYRSGRVFVQPCVDLSTAEQRRLIGSAEVAFREKPRKATGWLLRRGKSGSWWTCQVAIPVDERTDRVAAAIRSAQWPDAHMDVKLSTPEEVAVA